MEGYRDGSKDRGSVPVGGHLQKKKFGEAGPLWNDEMRLVVAGGDAMRDEQKGEMRGTVEG